MNKPVLVELDGPVLRVTLNRPDKLNSFNEAMHLSLRAAVARAEEEGAVRSVLLTGAGRGFCAGMDLKAFLTDGMPKGFNEFLTAGARKPLIAAIEGFALAGGLEVALTCDLLVAAKGVKLGIPEAGVGLFAAGGALLRLPRRVPYGVAMEMALTADPMSAEQAHEYALVTRLAEPGSAVDVALELAERVAKNAPLSVAASKQILRETQGRTEAEFWEFQAPLLRDVFTSEDAKEGPRAFAEKRAPNWTGK
jgi:enoyl-CoA hydratase/carnithine racemase